jgi:signal transduction histidine kinase
VEEVCDEWRPRAEEAGVTLTATLPADPVVVCMDRRRIAQVLRALVDNAIKFNRPSGKVEVVLEPLVDSVKLTVKDTGIGISEADLSHIFDIFSQLDHGSTRTHVGAGLGLAVARGLVQNHGGVIGVDSTVGTGSAFWFTLPTRCILENATPMVDQAEV